MNIRAFATLSFLQSPNDEEAMCLVKSHDDEHQFARLMKRWDEPIRRLCTRMVGDLHRGEDLKQETFLRLFQKRKDYQPTARFSTFLWRIALNLCYDELRRQQRRREFLREPPPSPGDETVHEDAAEGPAPDMRAAQTEEGELVRQALLELPEIYRAVIVLRHYEGLKLTKIAEILEIPEGTVNSRMAEALSRLSRLLEPKLKGKLLDNRELRPAVSPVPARRDEKDSRTPPNNSQSLITNYGVLLYESSNT